MDLDDPGTVARLVEGLAAAQARDWRAAPAVGGRAGEGLPTAVMDPAAPSRQVGVCLQAGPDQARTALHTAAAAAAEWQRKPVSDRADCLRLASEAMESDEAALIWLLCREAGRTLQDAHLEVREAVDFLRYYAAQAERLQAGPIILPGPTGESNQLRYRGRGPFLCISPWNFPLAIFTGQVAAALVTGNPVLAKPAEQTPLVAAAAVRMLHAAGVPAEVLQLLPGDGAELAGALLQDPRLAGVAFTGSFETARAIQRELAQRRGPIVPLIAETGGVNTMIVDATALPEQVTRDVLQSAFRSAGQRCSAARLLCLQDDIADSQIAMIAGAMQELRLGDPSLLSTDVGPVIDEVAYLALQAYRERARERFRILGEAPAAADGGGWFVRPCLFEVESAADVPEEIFGPFLHVLRWPADGLTGLLEDINALGYGLTLAIHSRSARRVSEIARRARVGNVYVNRNQIGAVVGSQPFGGEGRSGTGPKAGGPNYLLRFVAEQTLCEDTTAAGGNASLFTLEG
jgi:RHH-type proline utilization regulon transcriptional repressor/proline dehydrogenase/delta 1-pyrroline-5-carboxylate dehydrogenase